MSLVGDTKKTGLEEGVRIASGVGISTISESVAMLSVDIDSSDESMPWILSS